MPVLVFILALVLAIAGGGGVVAGFDLLPTERGLLYVSCGIMALTASVIVTAIGALIVRIESQTVRLLAALRSREREPKVPPSEPWLPPFKPVFEPAKAPAQSVEPAPEPEAEDPINEDRAGHLPTLQEVEKTLAHPEPQPKVVGRYSSGGANYVIFSDGAIEFESDDGQYKFASLKDFRSFLAEQRRY